jgi:hypothetical protein
MHHSYDHGLLDINHWGSDPVPGLPDRMADAQLPSELIRVERRQELSARIRVRNALNAQASSLTLRSAIICE